jgi:uncharacterized protein YutE (UPF0331/DUF86 family)
VVDQKKVSFILNNLQGFLDKLAILANYPPDEFTQDFTKVESAKHLLQVSVESCIDLAHHMIADEGFRTPKDSYDAFVILYEEGVLPEEFLPTLRQMVSFRNRVVHLYWAVEETILYQTLQKNLGDFKTYVHHLLNYLGK